jgi:hypothetical protein
VIFAGNLTYSLLLTTFLGDFDGFIIYFFGGARIPLLSFLTLLLSDDIPDK